MKESKGESMQDLNHRVATVLRVGTGASIILVIVGLMLMASGSSPDSNVAVPLHQMDQKLASLDPIAFITIGILIMVLTPVARVFVLVGSFAWRKDMVYVLIGLFVLVSLLVSLTLRWS
jgi:uncharacterized membrane protein